MRHLVYVTLVASSLLASNAAAVAQERYDDSRSAALDHRRQTQPQLPSLGTGESTRLDPSRRLESIPVVARASDLIGQPGKPLALLLPEETAVAGDARFLMIRGLPQGFQLSQGFSVKQTWFLSVTEAKNLQMTSPANFTGDLTLEVLYCKDSKEPPLRSVVRTVVIKSDSQPNRNALTPAVTPTPSLRKIQLTAEREADALRRGEDLMKHGDVAAARLLFEDIAAMGSAKGALAMAQSYDREHLRKFFIQGPLQPDPERAKTWYENAARLGSRDAERALSALQGGAR